VGVNNAAQINLNEGFITEEDMKAVGTLTHSVEAKRMLGAGDAVYLEFDKLDEVRIGQQYSIYKLLNDVVHPQSEEILGQKVQVLGIAEIDTVEEHVARARIVRSFTEIERGARLVPLLNHYQVVAPKQNLLDLTGMIVDSFREVQELGQFHVAFVDKGSKDGVQVGNRLFVMRRGGRPRGARGGRARASPVGAGRRAPRRRDARSQQHRADHALREGAQGRRSRADGTQLLSVGAAPCPSPHRTRSSPRHFARG
jgi:hypothetical protein